MELRNNLTSLPEDTEGQMDLFSDQRIEATPLLGKCGVRQLLLGKMEFGKNSRKLGLVGIVHGSQGDEASLSAFDPLM